MADALEVEAVEAAEVAGVELRPLAASAPQAREEQSLLEVAVEVYRISELEASTARLSVRHPSILQVSSSTHEQAGHV